MSLNTNPFKVKGGGFAPKKQVTAGQGTIARIELEQRLFNIRDSLKTGPGYGEAMELYSSGRHALGAGKNAEAIECFEHSLERLVESMKARSQEVILGNAYGQEDT